MMYAPLYLLAYLWAFWLVYVLVMGLYRAHLSGHLRGAFLILALPVVALGYVMDVATNLTVASAVFWELPKELTVTKRLRRLKRGIDWRARLAASICEKMLDIFDPSGSHCD